jgi:hypothetical protein
VINGLLVIEQRVGDLFLEFVVEELGILVAWLCLFLILGAKSIGKAFICGIT